MPRKTVIKENLISNLYCHLALDIVIICNTFCIYRISSVCGLPTNIISNGLVSFSELLKSFSLFVVVRFLCDVIYSKSESVI